VHELAARLLATGIRHDLISRAIYDTAPVRLRAAARRGLRRRRSSPDAVGGLGPGARGPDATT
jgi:phosphoesterase RecJ-like protein